MLHVGGGSCSTSFGFQIFVNGSQWLESNSVAFRLNGIEYSSGSQNLLLASCIAIYGQDPGYGKYEGSQWTWKPNFSGAPSFVTSLKIYSSGSSLAFVQEFPQGATGTSANDPHCDRFNNSWIGCDWYGVAAGFPIFAKSSPVDSAHPLAWLEFYGEHLNDAHNQTHRGPQMGLFSRQTQVPEGLLAGPMAWFDLHNHAIVLSSLSSHMNWGLAQSETSLQFGIMGSVDTIPAGFSAASVLTASSGGLSRAFDAWGSALLVAQGKPTVGWEQGDVTISHVGYETDNGAFYYYHPLNDDYLATLSKVQASYLSLGITVAWANLDSWRYYKGPGGQGGEGVPMAGGLKNWTTQSSAFPGGDAGVAALHRQTGWPLMAHNRWFQNVTDYASQNSAPGRFDYVFHLESDSVAYPSNGCP